jgi:HAD superfamily hydrolase (TIGR01509 family)
MFLEFLAHLGVPFQPPAVPADWGIAFTPAERAAQAAWRAERTGRPLAAIVPASAVAPKDWPADRWAAVADVLAGDLGYEVALVGGPGARETAAARTVVERARHPVTWAMGDGVRRLAWVLDACALALAPDTGPLHIARALGVPTVGLYGHTNPWRVGPYRAYEDLWVDAYTPGGAAPDPSAFEPPADDRMARISVADVVERVRRASARDAAARDAAARAPRVGRGHPAPPGRRGTLIDSGARSPDPRAARMLTALIFDLDGTLVDTNELHTESWVRGFARLGYKIDADRVRPEMGKGGDNLAPDVLGRAADERDGERLREAVGEEYKQLAPERGVRVFDGAVELLAELRRRGLRTALATSSGAGDLEATFGAAGVDLREHVDVVVMKDDVARSKPYPDVVLAALEKLGLSPAECAMVGDTPHDAEAAKRAGVITLGVLCGGMNDARTLVGAGARRVYDGPADLLSRLDEALEAASPTRTRLTQAALEGLMREALAAAEEGMAAGEVPIGCAIADGDGRVVARGYNEMNRTGNKTAHAEIVTFARAAGALPIDARDFVLVSTLEPCVMCTGAAMEAAVDTIVYALRAPADSGTGRVRPPESPESQMPRIVGDVLAGESRRLFERWLDAHRGEPQAAYVEQLLGLVKGGEHGTRTEPRPEAHPEPRKQPEPDPQAAAVA